LRDKKKVKIEMMVKTKYKKKITQIIKIFATNVVKVQLYIVFTGFWADKIDQ